MRNKAEKHVYRFAHFSMGTTFEILIVGSDEKYAQQASQSVFAEVDRIERLFNRFNPCSELGQINSLRSGQSLRIGMETYDVLRTALRIYSQTQGAFDINVGSLLKYESDAASGYNGARPNIMNLLELSRTARGFVLEIRPVEKERQEMALALDLGGIGKGYALDRTLDILSDWDIDRALVHGGSSTALAVGSPPGDPAERGGWPVGIGGGWECLEAPRKYILKDRALSGSGTEVKGKHILDPRSGKPATGHLAAWVSHPSAAVSDALSTAFMVMDTEEVSHFCMIHSDVWALVVVDSRTCRIFNRDIAAKTKEWK
jgi:thiamine biosynthesis lipoprotein